MELTDLASTANMTVFDLYSLVCSLAADPDRNVPKKEIDKIRYGVNVPFDLLRIKAGRFVPKLKANVIVIGDSIISCDDYDDDMESRKQLGLTLFQLALEQKDVLKSR